MLRRAIACLLAATAFPAAAARAQDPRDTAIRIEQVRDHVYVLFGQGGNIGLSIGDDGTCMIDDQYAPLTGRILAAVKALSDKPVRFLVNTHWHNDHTGGNANLGEAGAVLVAHENVRRAMSVDHFMKAFNRTVPAAPAAALPVLTFADAIDLYCNGDHLHVFHVAPAHTDGDAIVHFEKANVFHMGDVYFSNGYPFLDVQNGGNIDGMVAACDRVLARADAGSRFIPGHGPVTGVRELEQYRDMLKQVGAAVHELVDAGKSRADAIAARPTAAFDATWGKSFMRPDVWVGIVYDGIAEAAKRGDGGDAAERSRSGGREAGR